MRRILLLLAIAFPGGCSESPSPLREMLDDGVGEPARPAPEFVLTWGAQGDGPGAFRAPEDVEIGPDGLVYVLDVRNYRIQVFQPDGTYVRHWGAPGSSPGELVSPTGIAADAFGHVFVAQWQKITKFTTAGDFVTEWMVDTAEDRHGLLAIAAAGDGSVYVTDGWGDRVEKYTGDGSRLLEWGSFGEEDGQFRDPHGITVAPDGTIAVTDTDNARIQIFAADGTFLRAWGVRAEGDGYFRGPFGIARDPDGNYVIVDVYRERIQTFTSEGAFITGWGDRGPGLGEFHDPAGVATDADGRIYVADRGNDRIQVFAYPE